MKIIIFCMALLLVVTESLAEISWQPDSSTLWPAAEGQAEIELRGDYLGDFGVEVLDGGQPQPTRYRTSWPVARDAGTLWIYAPFGNFEWLTSGSIRLQTGLGLGRGPAVVLFDEVFLVPAERGDLPGLQLHDRHGTHLANITHLHAEVFHDPPAFTLRNADIVATARLAERLNQPALAGMPLGQIWLDLAVEMPAQADMSQQGFDLSDRGLTCDDRPHWPQDGYEADVALIDMATVAAGSFEPKSGYLKIIPSATLKNVGEADIPWLEQFYTNPDLYPYEPADQHPFLRWGIYRIHEGRLEQLASSGTKHAFWTMNVNCDLNCGSGRVLWPGCEDPYGVGSNDTPDYQGPNEEVRASLGLWDSCGSFFDPDCTGEQTQDSGWWENRLLVDPAELHSPGAEYFVDSWYVVQFDIDIWNTMGYRQVTPNQTPEGGYTFGPLGPFTQGSPMGQWVDPNNPGPMADHQVVVVESLTPNEPYPNNMPQGHLRVLVRVEALGGNQYRYRYAVMNFDLDRGVNEFRVAVPDGVTIGETWMGGPPDELDSAWNTTQQAAALVFAAPAGQILPWFTLYNFEFTSDSPPATGEVRLGLAGNDLPRAVTVATLAPEPPAGIGGFDLEATPTELDACVPDQADFEISVIAEDGFAEPVTLSAPSLPAGATGNFTVNPVSPGGSSVLEINLTGAGEGDYTIPVNGAGGDQQASVAVTLVVSESVTDPVALSAPADQADDVEPDATFSWSADPLATEYRLQIASGDNFDAPQIDTVVGATSHAPGGLAAMTQYQWRVRGENACGEGPYSDVRVFTTSGDGDNPVPVLDALEPDRANVGAEALVLAISGQQFHPDATVWWDNVELDAEWLDADSMTAQVPAALLVAEAEVPVMVVNPAPGGGASEALIFIVSDDLIFRDRFEE